MGGILKFPSSIYDSFNILTEVIYFIFILKFHYAHKFLFIAKIFKLSRYFSHFIFCTYFVALKNVNYDYAFLKALEKHVCQASGAFPDENET